MTDQQTRTARSRGTTPQPRTAYDNTEFDDPGAGMGYVRFGA
jgi:hypothetical protein